MHWEDRRLSIPVCTEPNKLRPSPSPSPCRSRARCNRTHYAQWDLD
nr:MAG TPA: hypothetical protein [Bacteriophage sp.]